jgi:hypothetical protein
MQPYMGLGNSLQTAQASVGGGGAGGGGWVELARTTLGTAGDSISIASLPDKRYYMLLGNHFKTGAIAHALQMNSDTGTSYSNRCSISGGVDFTNVSRTRLENWGSGNTNPDFLVAYVSNLASKEKLVTEHFVDRGTAGAGNAPNRRENVGKWSNTSNSISEFDSFNYGAGDFTTGSEVVVLGWDPEDTHTSDFWEELASVELGSAGDEISSGTITAKKYLWVQCYTKSSGTQRHFMRFNNDTAANYARRWSENGAGDGTGGSATAANIYGLNESATGSFSNTFIINNSANEKLLISHGASGSSAGAGTAPNRGETVNKWTNTSSQITEIDIINPESGDFDTGSIIKVWGSD